MTDKPRTDAFRKVIGKLALEFKMPDFIPDESASKEIQASVNKASKKNEDDNVEEEKKEEKEEKVNLDEDIGAEDVAKLKDQLIPLLKSLRKPKEGQTYEDTLIKPEEFEKDQDNNFHMDFVHAMANCRASSYKLDLMDWIQVKLKAGRIVPAMATTTAAIAGL